MTDTAMMNTSGKPARGFGHYLRDMVYGALDGVITTLAVVSGSAGAQLEPRIGLILGISNLVADGLSMGASNYLALKSELEQTGKSVAEEMPWRHGLATFAAFGSVGAAPLLAYYLPRPDGMSIFTLALLLAFLTLMGVGSVRARYVRQRAWRSSAEVIGIAGLASATAFLIGSAVEWLTR
jgi:VIT1/CCC1 family predicted Fe2+/Mn2+ transporter